MRIVLIEKAHRGVRFVIHFDEGADILLTREVIIDFGLRKNDEIDDARLREIKEVQSYHDAYAAAIRLLNYRMRTKKEISQRLEKKTFPTPIVERVIERLSGLGLLDDSVYAEAYISDKGASKPIGKRELERRLREKGLSKDTISDALAMVGSDEKQFELAAAAAETKIRSLARFTGRQKQEKLIAFLLRRGFEWGVVKKVVETITKGDLDEAVL
ncbi:MAG: RecX family transcriptional regulator [Bacteroidetes bacterium]|nr:RecX family transcriptional regulator [Bacteroidota bacterium]